MQTVVHFAKTIIQRLIGDDANAISVYVEALSGKPDELGKLIFILKRSC